MGTEREREREIVSMGREREREREGGGEKDATEMYFLCAGHKSWRMFLAGYFIGASDRWSWCKKENGSPTSSLANEKMRNW